MPRLKEALDLTKLTQEGLEFEIDSDVVKDHESSGEDYEENPQEKTDYANQECIGIFDEDAYEGGVSGEPFEVIGSKMSCLLPNGKIKKRIIRPGDGEKPVDHALVKIHYNAYLEYEEHPFDSSYERNRPMTFILNDGRVIAGLDHGVQSMTVNEKSQFLIHADYAYGHNCLIGRVPKSATVLFEVELLEVVNCGAALEFEKLTEDQQKLFPEVYKYCTALCERGKNHFVKHQFKKAIKDYNEAAVHLEKVFLKNEYREKHRELALKVYSNLLICYIRIEKYRKACVNAKKIYSLTENGELIEIPAKVFYNHAKCLRLLGEYQEAKIALDKAYKLQPKNPDIANELVTLENDLKEAKESQLKFAKALCGYNK